ncbi:MAG: hypothetical protein ACLPSL_09400 [Smithella sp.]
MKWKYFIGWLSLLVIAFINGAFRQIVFQNSLGDLRAHQLSTAIGISLFGIYIYWIIRRWQPESLKETMQIGFLWMVLTIVFEIGMARLFQNRDWSSVFRDYNILEGRVWILVLLWVAIAPSLFYKIQKKNDTAV